MRHELIRGFCRDRDRRCRDRSRRTNRREAPNGWSTSFIGVARNTIEPGETPPAEDALHPVAFLVEKRPGGITRPHFHRADQYQVVVGGQRQNLGLHETGSVAVHYTRRVFRPYGPIVAAGDGIAWFTLRPGLGSPAPGTWRTPTTAPSCAPLARPPHALEAVTDPLPPPFDAALRSVPSIG